MKKRQIPKPNRPLHFAQVPVAVVKKIINKATPRLIKAKRFLNIPR
jgi:hypothetical protein